MAPHALDDTLGGTAPGVGAPAIEGPPAAGRVIGGRYRILRPIGAGAMGQVFEARHLTTERRVAVKLLHAGVDHDPTVLQRFTTEARAAGRARHRNIVEVIDFGADGPTHWMVLEYLDGESLEAFVEREAPLAPARVGALLDPLLRAIAHAHAMGFIHRDLKPGNLFLAREEGTDGVVPKVLDFGIAKHTGSAVKLTGTDTIVGTPAYMAPEQIESSRDVGPAADQYAMGCVAFEMLSGTLPVAGETLHGLLVAKATREPEALASLRPDLPPALCACVMRALARDPSRRYPDLDGFRRALVAACADQVTSEPSVAAPAAPLPPAEPRPTRRQRPLLVALAALGCAGLLALAAVTSARAPAAPSPAPTATPVRPSNNVRPAVEAPAPVAAAPPAPVALSPSPPSPDAAIRPARAPRRRERPRRAEGRRLSVDPTNPL